MKNVTRSVMLATAASLLVAPLAFGQATDAEFKCEAKATQASTKFVGSKSKCIQKCLAGFWKVPSLNPSSDCFPPYGGATLTCITDSLKGAEGKFAIAIKKSCDPATASSAQCPSCYDSGDCTDAGYATDYVQTIEGQVDSFVPGVACEVGADKGEQKCMTNTAKALSKQVAGVVKCYIKCFTSAHKGLISPSVCQPPASDPATATCISGVDAKAIAAVDKLCGLAGQIPDCTSPGSDDYPNGSSWVNLVDIAISGNVPNNFCAAP